MAGAVLNSRETRRLGQEIRADLRREAQAKGLPSSQELPAGPGWEPPSGTELAWSAQPAQTPRRKSRRRRRKPGAPEVTPPNIAPQLNSGD
jgi:hypothetical protein